MKSKRTTSAWVAVLCSIVLVAGGAALASSPAMGKAGLNWTSIWKTKLQHQADQRYYTKTQAKKAFAPKPRTVRGTYTVIGDAVQGSLGTSISWGWSFDAAPKVHYVESGATPPAACPGSVGNPKAKAGHLCIYENVAINRQAPVICAATNDCGVASPFGALIVVFATAPTHVDVSGSWAATPAHRLTSKAAVPSKPRGGPTGG